MKPKTPIQERNISNSPIDEKRLASAIQNVEDKLPEIRESIIIKFKSSLIVECYSKLPKDLPEKQWDAFLKGYLTGKFDKNWHL